MDPIFDDFRQAFVEGKGYDLSQTLSPIPSPSQPQKLYNFFRSTNFATVQKDLKYQILYNNASPFQLPPDQGNRWVEVYHAYWKAVGDVLNAENAPKTNTKASFNSSRPISILLTTMENPHHVISYIFHKGGLWIVARGVENISAFKLTQL